MPYYTPEPPPYADAPHPAQLRLAVEPTPAERMTARRWCVMCGSASALLPVWITARPNGGGGGFAEYLTPHRVCPDDAASPEMTLDAIARPGEQELIRGRAAAEKWWRPEAIVLGVAAGWRTV